MAIVLPRVGVSPRGDMAHFYSWLTFVLSTLVIATIASEFIRGGRVLQGKLQTNIFGAMYHLTRRNMRRYGGYVVHFGVVLVVIGVAGQAFNQEKEQEMGLGDKLAVGHYIWLARNTHRTTTPITNPSQPCWMFIKTANILPGWTRRRAYSR